MGALLYKDGKTEPKRGDKVLGNKLKGTVSNVLKEAVSVSIIAPFNPKRPADRKTIQVERDPAELELLYRKS